MCGIAGSFGDDPLDRSRVDQALTHLARRGPDASGMHRAQVGPAVANLLHTRLAVIDLNPRANQPFLRDGLALAFNGEIYNYLEIAEQLRARGHVLSTGSDTEVLLEAYRCWGIDCLDRLEGMWAFALLDTHADRLILSRDRFGEKPLFFTRRNGTLYFASEPKAVAALLGSPLEVNSRHIRRYLANGFRSLFKTGDTFHAGLYELPAASVLSITADGREKLWRYWRLEHAPDRMTAEDAVAGVRDLLRKSLRLRLRADVPLAFCLSGGIDSSALASLAARDLGASVHAFSVIDKDERYDETENIMATVNALGCDHFIVRTSTERFFDRMADLVAYHDAPVPTISYYMHSFLSEAIAGEGCKVAVSGTGADEIFTGYYDHYAFWLAEYADAPDFDGRLAEWRNGYGRWINNPLLQDPLKFHREPGCRDHLFQNRDLFNSFLVEPIDEDFAEENYTGNLLRNRMLNELHHEVVPVILRADDMNSMRVSVENRSPYLDRALVEFGYCIPNNLLIRDGLAKWPLREAVKGVVPEVVRCDSRKRGFNASIDSLIDRSDPRTCERLLASSPIFDLVKRSAVEKFLSKDMSDNSFSKFLFYFVSAKLFLEANVGPAAVTSLATTNFATVDV